jgi:hypothetical protein
MEAINTTERQIEMQLLAKLILEDEGREGWRVALAVEEIPAEIGSYSIQDGLSGKGAGVTLNMRRSIQESWWTNRLTRPIFLWKSDTDGSVALWLDGKIRCSRCPDKPIISLDDIDEHGEDVHGDDKPCHCDDY